MKRIFFSFCIIFAFVTVFHAGDLYRCVDRNGNMIVTSFPDDEMKDCVLKDSFEDSAVKEQATEKKNVIQEKAAVKKEDTDKEREERIKDCINCCSSKRQACYNYTADSRRCGIEQDNCIATCDSEGASASAWSECWSQSKK